MRLLLDTSVFVRWSNGAPIPRSVMRMLRKQTNECVVSIVSGWEITIKPKLRISVADIETGIGGLGATLLPIRMEHLAELSRLPIIEEHRDPFDRLLIAQALAENLPIVSSDAKFAAYQRLRVLWD